MSDGNWQSYDDQTRVEGTTNLNLISQVLRPRHGCIFENKTRPTRMASQRDRVHLRGKIETIKYKRLLNLGDYFTCYLQGIL